MENESRPTANRFNNVGDHLMFLAFLLGGMAAFAWVYLAVANGKFWLPLMPEPTDNLASAASVDIIVPARNEASILPHTLPSLLAQAYPGEWKVILVDDHSTDGTADLARKIAADMKRSERLTVMKAPDLAANWSGKVAAMNVGVIKSEAEFILFTDADIRHPRRSIEKLVARAQDKKLDLISRMVRLNCESVAEKLLIPAFVFFFAMIYPFRRANNPASRTAAAAGGTILVRRSLLNAIGGLGAIKSALIDDCSLAKEIKQAGGQIELTMTKEIISVRPYPRITDVWKMVSRTAYTQLKHSPLALVATITGLSILFFAPYLLLLFAPPVAAPMAGLIAAILMISLYAPIVRFYGLPFAWTLTLPVAALVYAAATVDSARLYHLGKGGQWKGRAQA